MRKKPRKRPEVSGAMLRSAYGTEGVCNSAFSYGGKLHERWRPFKAKRAGMDVWTSGRVCRRLKPSALLEPATGLPSKAWRVKRGRACVLSACLWIYSPLGQIRFSSA